MKTKTSTYQDGLQELRGSLKKVIPEELLNVFDNDAQNLHSYHKTILKLTKGDKAPDFELFNAVNTPIKLSSLLNQGRVVLTFYRGTWCPYCNLQLAHYQKALKNIQSLGAQLIAISPQIPDESLNIKEKNELKFEVLSDIGNRVAQQFTSVFKNGDVPINAMKELGIDFDSYYSDDSKELPIPAVFIIEKDRTITFAKSLGGNYRERVEVTEILNALKK